jgi:ubiquinone/menaquinone biosynthesis C-methylase UbiE
MWTAALAGYTARGLDLLRPPPAGRGLDVACGPGVSTRALRERMPSGEVSGVDFAPEMVERATERHRGAPGLSFAVDDAEHLSLPDASYDAVTCSFGLMYCYDARSALAHMARVVRPGGRLMLVVWGRAARVWWSPVIELIETRATYYSAICPMMFFFGLPGVLARMMGEAGLRPVAEETIVDPMRFPSVEAAVEAALLALPTSGLYANRLDADAQAEVRDLLTSHVRGCADQEPDEVGLASEVVAAVAERPA